MKMNDYFSVKRFRLLIKKDFRTQYKTYLIAMGAIFGILCIVNISSIASYKSWDFNLVFYPLTLFIGGFIFTSLSFNDLTHEQSRISYLTLPVSCFEKFVSKLFVTSIGYTVVSLVFYFVFTVIVFVFNSLVFGVAHRIFDPFHPVILLCIGIYLVTHSIFLLGALYFRRNSFIKTIFALFAAAIAYWAFITFVGFITFYLLVLVKQIDFPFDLFFKGLYYPSIPPVINDIIGVFVIVVQALFWFVLAPLSWITGFFRLKEIEV
jgi:hypothetical protein